MRRDRDYNSLSANRVMGARLLSRLFSESRNYDWVQFVRVLDPSRVMYSWNVIHKLFSV